jgi:outer membrane immunogenic protein
MKKLLLTSIALAGLIGPATAADLARPVYRTPVAVAAPIYTWTGCYLGAHVGAGVHHSDWTDEEFGIGSGAGAVAGGQVGCNYQIRQLVVGVEGEFYWSGLEAIHDDLTTPGREFHFNAKNTRDASVALRLGFAFDRLLLYGKVGADWGRLEWTSVGITQCDTATCTIQSFAERTGPGILLGTGFEYAFLDNWTAKLEYNYINYGHPLVSFTQTCSGPVGPEDCLPFAHTRRDEKHILKVGLNYKFGYAAVPVYK